jgi:hypothetical protein
MLHALFLLSFMLAAAPLAKFIPLAALAGVLVVVCWSMEERRAFWVLLRSSRGDAAVLLVTFLLTIFSRSNRWNTRRIRAWHTRVSQSNRTIGGNRKGLARGGRGSAGE